MDDKKKEQETKKEQKAGSEQKTDETTMAERIDDMKREMEDYLEEQGVYIRQ